MHDEQSIPLKTVAQLLQINAIKVNLKNPFTWVSGIRSPIYCDNRQVLSYPDIRASMASDMAAIISREFPFCEVIAGVATGAIAHGVLVAERLNKPFIYVRSSVKGHGLGNRVEGRVEAGSKVVVIEDLVSTGKSSIEALQALRQAGLDVLGMVALFTYELPHAIKAMELNNCTLFSLGNFSALLEQLQKEQRLSDEDMAGLTAWRNNPDKYYGDI